MSRSPSVSESAIEHHLGSGHEPVLIRDQEHRRLRDLVGVTLRRASKVMQEHRLDLEIAKTERYDGCDFIATRASVARADLAALAARYPEDAALAPYAT